MHLAAHGGKQGVRLIGGRVDWADVAEKLKIVAPRLTTDQKRVLVLSCCHSSSGYAKLKARLRNHFTGCYYFAPQKIGFSDATTTWAMFYKRKTIDRPHGKVVDRINAFFDDKIIVFDSI